MMVSSHLVAVLLSEVESRGVSRIDDVYATSLGVAAEKQQFQPLPNPVPQRSKSAHDGPPSLCPTTLVSMGT